MGGGGTVHVFHHGVCVVRLAFQYCAKDDKNMRSLYNDISNKCALDTHLFSFFLEEIGSDRGFKYPINVKGGS